MVALAGKGSSIVTAVAQAAAVAWVQSLGWETLVCWGSSQKKKKKKKKWAHSWALLPEILLQWFCGGALKSAFF